MSRVSILHVLLDGLMACSILSDSGRSAFMRTHSLLHSSQSGIALERWSGKSAGVGMYGIPW